jgi:multiple sugar transport system permease protein
MANKKVKRSKKIATGINNNLFPAFELRVPANMFVYRVWGGITIAGALLAVIPFAWMLITAMMPGNMIFMPLSEVFKSFRIDSTYFQKAWEITPFPRYFLNSLLVASVVVLGQVFLSAMAAYSISKLKPRGYTTVMILFMSTMLIPFETITIPLYLFMRDFSVPYLFKFNLLNTYWALIFPGLANAFNIFIFKSFFDKLPNDFIEAARVDGYSETGIFWKIIMPISKPILIVISLLNFVNIWNSFFWPLIVVNETGIYKPMLGIYKINEEGHPLNLVMTADTISMVPTILLFTLFQKQIMKGVVFTSLQE